MIDDVPDSAVIRDGALQGLSCVVTGAGTGIGRAISLRLVALGAVVTGIGRRPASLAETAALTARMAGAFLAEACDIRDADAADALLARIGAARGIDALVNNAGGQFVSPAQAISRRGWDAVIDLNLSAVFRLSRAAHPFLARRGGSIVNMSLSLAERGQIGIAHSVAARAGVLGLTRTLALEWAPDRIRLNCIGPGTVMSGGLAGNYSAGAIARIDNAAPLGRNTTAEEVAELTAFLVSPAGAMMTGQLLHIGGGTHLGPGIDMLGGGGAG